MHLFDPLVRWASDACSAGNGRHGLPILFYHRVLPEPDPLQPDTVDCRVFRHHLSAITRVYEVVPLSVGVARLRSGTLRRRSLCLTFDDGYRDNFDCALPILREFGCTATFFASSGFLNGGRIFADTALETVRRLSSGTQDFGWLGLGRREVRDIASRRQLVDDLTKAIKYLSLEQRSEACDRLEALAASALPEDLMMNPSHVLGLHRAGMSIGGHTVDHPILSTLPADKARAQIILDRDTLGGITGVKPEFFAYPNGKPGIDFTPEHTEMVKDAGYVGAVSTRWGVGASGSNLYELPRISPWQRSSLRLLYGLARSMRSIDPADGRPAEMQSAG